jgi:signal peptidase I
MKASGIKWLVFILALAASPVARCEGTADPLADARTLASAHDGLRVMRVQGASMMPFFDDGAVVVVKSIPVERLYPGMVIVYRNRFGETIAHRLVAAVAGGWRIKGEANGRPRRWHPWKWCWRRQPADPSIRTGQRALFSD